MKTEVLKLKNPHFFNEAQASKIGCCNDGELECFQTLFSVVPVLVSKTCQRLFSEPEDKWHSITCIHLAKLSSIPQSKAALFILPTENSLSSLYHPSFSLVLPRTTFISTAHNPAMAHADRTTDKCKAVLKLCWTWAGYLARVSFQQPATMGRRGEHQHTIFAKYLCHIATETVQKCDENTTK